jgi:two-component sensor histidine kinase
VVSAGWKAECPLGLGLHLARAEREEFARQIRDKDTLLKEVQHRVKNNLQLVVALIRLESPTSGITSVKSRLPS